MSDLRALILGADDRPYEDVEEWGTTVRLRGLSGAASQAFSLRVQSAGDDLPPNLMAELLVLCIEDPETGELVFDADDVEALGAKSGRALSRLFKTAQELSGMGNLDEAKND